ncbi:MAG TPA: sugar-binding protein [Phycisphaerae bacterium]|nr:sugar-binding protein [Phycisphaerae bacterium]
MKWLLRAAFGSLLALAAGAQAAEPIPIRKAPATIAVDGVLDEAAWKQAQVIEADYVWGQVGRRSEQPQMRVRYTWDAHYLYVGYETFDRNLVALGTGQKEGPGDNLREGCAITHPTKKPDVVELFISFGDLRFFWEVHHNAANQFNDIWCVVVDKAWPISKSSMNRFGIQFLQREYLQDDAATGRRLATAVALKPKADGKPSTINDPNDVDTGYTGELRLPWLGLGAPRDRETWVTAAKTGSESRPPRHRGPWKMAGQEIRILAVVQNGDLKERYHHSSPTKPGDWFHKGAQHYPRYVLRGE